MEGCHSLGWGATPEQLMFATRENYLHGCTLLNLHGLYYYSIYGSHWEWAPPWSFDLSGSLKAGENEIDVLVFNTLSNHYQTIPSSYRGDPMSGLFGPVRVLSYEDMG